MTISNIIYRDIYYCHDDDDDDDYDDVGTSV